MKGDRTCPTGDAIRGLIKGRVCNNRISAQTSTVPPLGITSAIGLSLADVGGDLSLFMLSALKSPPKGRCCV